MHPMTTRAKFNRYSIALQDFDRANGYATHALNYPINTIEYEALLFAAIICYVRPFSRNEVTNMPQAVVLLRLEDFSTLTDQERHLHDHCLRLRNKALAHSEFEMNPTSLNEETGIVSSRPFSLVAQQVDVHRLAALSARLLEECHKRRGDYISKLGERPSE